MKTQNTNVTDRTRVKFRVLSDDQIKHIHSSALEVLDKTGIYVGSREALDLLENGGCRVSGNTAKFPPGLVEWALSTAPSQFLLYDRNRDHALNVGGYNVYFGLGPTLLYMIDSDTGEHRKFVRSDTEKVARLCDALPNIEWVMGLGTISDCAPEHQDVLEFSALARNTTKPLIIWCQTTDGVKDIIEMASTVAGGMDALTDRPFIASYSEPISPLIQNKEAVEKLLLTAKAGIPTVHTPIPQAGASAPTTLAGELVSVNAENLATVVISQLAREGSPIVIGGVIGTMDMKHAQLAYGSPEMQLMLAAYMDIAHYYDIPTWGTGGCTDSKLVDQQAAIEATHTVLYSALSGANLVHDPGYMGSGTVGALEMIAMVDEIVGMVKYIIEGMRVDDYTLALDIVDKVGHGGEFLTSPHTMQNFREQLWQPTLLDRQPHDKWEKAGAKTMGDRLKEKVRHILETHQPEPLPDETLEALDKMLPGES